MRFKEAADDLGCEQILMCSRTDRVAMGKYDRTKEQDMQIVLRVQEPAERCGVKMQKNIF